jgi:hypothetical protein
LIALSILALSAWFMFLFSGELALHLQTRDSGTKSIRSPEETFSGAGTNQLLEKYPVGTPRCGVRSA